MKKRIISLLCLAAGFTASMACEHDHKSHTQNVVPAKTHYFPLEDVRLLDSPFRHAMELNATWMMELDTDRLLCNFRKNAGLPPKAESYGSWESMGIAGHTLGHLLTALSQQYAATGEGQYKNRIDYIVNQLDSCQTTFVNGFIGGMPGGDKVFKEVKKGIIRSKGFDLNGIWVPWYNEHKTMMGLADAYRLAHNDTALKVLVELSAYLADVIADLSKEQMQEMLNCEYGGMNEAFAEVYALTGDKKFLDASYAFYHERLQDKLAAHVDALQGLHSNTQIPKIIGSARQYELTGNQRDYEIATFAWNTLVHHHSYANGGNSMGEYLSVPDRLNDRLGTNTCETCNTYNMLKLTRYLYEWSNDPHYLDYYERALYNHILASQHPVDGRVCYFLSLGMGTEKGFGGKQNNFTCCMGSGFENHSKYGGAIYSHSPNSKELYVNLYIPSVLTWKETGIKLTMETQYPDNGNIRIRLDECPAQTMAINLRYPQWATEGVTVKVNGATQRITAQPGSFIRIDRKWKKADRIELSFPMTLHTEPMPDNADRRAVFYGPSLLAGTFGTAERKTGDIPVFVSEEKSLTNYIQPVKGQPATFVTQAKGGPDNIPMIPFYKVYDQYQTVYWDVYSPQEWKAVEENRRAELERIARLDEKTLDYIVLGEMQPERDHRLEGENTRVGEFKNRKYRFAYENGWFAFDMKCGHTGPTQLLMTFWGSDSGRYTFELVVDKDYVVPVTVYGTPDEFVEQIVNLPASLTQGKAAVNIQFRGKDKNRVSNLYNCRLMKADPSEQPTAVPTALNLHSFYKKYYDANGFPVVSSAQVDNEALIRAGKVINQILSKRPDVCEYMIKKGCKVMLIGQNEEVCDIPEYAHICDTPENIAHWNKRARGFGGSPEHDFSASCGEENVLGLPTDRYKGESILVHEFAHILHLIGIAGIDPSFDTKLEDLRQHAIANGLWKDTYAISNKEEYFAEGVQTFFNCNRHSETPNGVHNAISTREKLKTYDPGLYQLLLQYLPETEVDVVTANR